jgi:hypothetical protein
LLASKRQSDQGIWEEFSILDQSSNWSDQKELNTIFVVELIRILVEGTNQNTTINQVDNNV